MNAYMLYYATGVIMIPVLLFSFYCQIKVKRAFRRYSSVHAMCGMTGAQAAARLLQLNGINRCANSPDRRHPHRLLRPEE